MRASSSSDRTTYLHIQAVHAPYIALFFLIGGPMLGQTPLLPSQAMPAMGTYPVKAWFAQQAHVPEGTLSTGLVWDYSGYDFILDQETADEVMGVAGTVAEAYFEDADIVLYSWSFQETEYFIWSGDTLLTIGRHLGGRDEVEPIDPPMVWMWPHAAPGQRFEWHTNGLSDFPHQARQVAGRGKLITPRLVVEDAVLMIHFHEAPDNGRQFIFYRANDLLRPCAHIIPGKGMLLLSE